MNSLITVRPYNKATDEDMVYSSWLNFYRWSDFAKRIPERTFFENHRKVIDRIMQHPNAFGLVAVPANESEPILGYCIGYLLENRRIVHFTFVKKQFQKMGIAKELWRVSQVQPDLVEYTHRTNDSLWMIKKWPSIKYNPYAV